PNPIIFQHALDLAQAQKENSIMIGDCLEADVQGALDFGIDAVFFNPNKEISPKGIIEINHLLALKNYL
uniref:HAD hydrolase-like protein n=1 Tax=Flavobacterium sp. TaxID=239 RepID=UPI0025F64C0C